MLDIIFQQINVNAVYYVAAINLCHNFVHFFSTTHENHTLAIIWKPNMWTLQWLEYDLFFRHIIF